MKSATELLAEILAIYDEPGTDGTNLYMWLHQSVEEIREAIEFDAAGELEAIDRARGEGE